MISSPWLSWGTPTTAARLTCGVPKPPGEPVTDVRPHRARLQHHALQRAQLVFLALNAVPFAVGVVLSCAAEPAEASLYGRFTPGPGWGLLQLGVFAGSVWWYENRAR